MTDTTETLTDPTTPPPVPHQPQHDHRPNRLYQAAAWVAIVAGVVFIVGAVFFTGFALGRHSGGGDHHRVGPMLLQRGPGIGPGDMRPGMMGPGMMGPGDPDRPGPGTPPAPPSASLIPGAPR
jgi:hypothetical protein